MRRLLNVPGEEEILLKRIAAAAVARALETKGGRETALVTENVASESEISNKIVKDVMRGVRIRRHVDQEDIRRALCRAATTGEFFRLLPHMILSVAFLDSTAAFLKDFFPVFRLVAGSVNCRDVVACTEDGLRVGLIELFSTSGDIILQLLRSSPHLYYLWF